MALEEELKCLGEGSGGSDGKGGTGPGRQREVAFRRGKWG